MRKHTRKCLLRRIVRRLVAGTLDKTTAEIWMRQLREALHPNVTRVMVYGFHPTKARAG